MDSIMEVNTELIHSLQDGVYVENAVSADNITLYKVKDCIWAGRSAFCDEIVIANSPVYGKVLFLDKEIQSAESDEALYHTHLVHPVLNATAGVSGKRVLIVGGGEGATAREVLKWPAESVREVVWVDIDGGLVELCRRHLGWADDSVYNDPRLTYHSEDIRSFFARDESCYDVIILDLPDPDCDELKVSDLDDYGSYALYGHEFMAQVRAHLCGPYALVSHCGPIRPGELDGIHWMTNTAGLGKGFPYHTVIPSFQGSWGFWMSVPPAPLVANFPITAAHVMDSDAQTAAFLWPKYWKLMP
jgi:spermidine synthase